MLGGFMLALTVSAYSQNSDGYWKRLQKSHPETTLEALEKNAPAVSQAPSGEVVLPAFRLSLVFQGQERNVTLENIKLMEKTGLNPASIRQYRKELLFKSADKEVWLPVKSTLIDQLAIELRKDEQVLLYTSVLQGREQEEKQVTLLVEDFQVK
ncbi:hypothetical protein TH63_11425 [Rufibacter radiotolerans]|uniref:Uncharacterized protein n=2 Tax=Rufibacter radiotolerans TaxID=1379910 RepID=A0A0H4W6R0_9BACT|nr:hypothetical protein TH63_11425 [Rufibacter radiotolerans]